MNNELLPAQPNAVFPDVNEKPGTLLRQKRESLNLTQQQVADKLRLRITLIQSLEDNNFNIDKVTTFTRGYVRSYARVVGIEEKVILASYDSFCGVEKNELDMKSFSKRTKKEAHNSRINYITIGVILIVIGISSFWWYQNQSNDTLLSGSRPSQNEAIGSELSETFSAGPELPEEQLLSGTAEPSLVIEPRTLDTLEEESFEGPVQEEPSNVDAVEPSVATTDQVINENDATAPMIAMSFIDDCWIQIKDATGKTLDIGLKKPGQVVSLDGQAPFNVILGAPESVSMTFESEPVDLSRYTSGKVARFTLPR